MQRTSCMRAVQSTAGTAFIAPSSQAAGLRRGSFRSTASPPSLLTMPRVRAGNARGARSDRSRLLVPPRQARSGNRRPDQPPSLQSDRLAAARSQAGREFDVLRRHGRARPVGALDAPWVTIYPHRLPHPSVDRNLTLGGALLIIFSRGAMSARASPLQQQTLPRAFLRAYDATVACPRRVRALGLRGLVIGHVTTVAR